MLCLPLQIRILKMSRNRLVLIKICFILHQKMNQVTQKSEKKLKISKYNKKSRVQTEPTAVKMVYQPIKKHQLRLL